MNDISIRQTGGALTFSEEDLVSVLQSSLYPGAALASIKMVLGYCKAAGLDPMQKPVHIVPMWDSKAGQMRDVVMPGVGLYRTQAARTGRFAGQSESEFGPMIEASLGGVHISYPEWARVTVRKQLDNGAIAEFVGKEYWIENYAVKGGKEKSLAPNAMWLKRPRGQIAKCAAAQALRLAFPEMGAQPTADEMEGKELHAYDAPAALPTAQPHIEQVDVGAWIAKASAAMTDEEASDVWRDGSAKIAATKNVADYKVFKQAVIARRTALKEAADAARTIEIDPFVAEMNAAEEAQS